MFYEFLGTGLAAELRRRERILGVTADARRDLRIKYVQHVAPRKWIDRFARGDDGPVLAGPIAGTDRTAGQLFESGDARHSLAWSSPDGRRAAAAHTLSLRAGQDTSEPAKPSARA